MLSPAAAAKVAGVSRSAIMRAISSAELHARRDNRNRWQIDATDLDTWSANRPVQDRSVSNTAQVNVRTLGETDQNMFEQLSEIKAELAAAQAEIRGLEARLEDTQAERNRLAQLLDKAMTPPESFWSRIWRKPDAS